MRIHPCQSHFQSTRGSISSWQVGVDATAVSSWNQVVTRRTLSYDAFLSGVKQSSREKLNGGPLHPPIHRLGGSVDDHMRINATDLISVSRLQLTVLFVLMETPRRLEGPGDFCDLKS